MVNQVGQSQVRLPLPITSQSARCNSLDYSPRPEHLRSVSKSGLFCSILMKPWFTVLMTAPIQVRISTWSRSKWRHPRPLPPTPPATSLSHLPQASIHLHRSLGAVAPWSRLANCAARKSTTYRHHRAPQWRAIIQLERMLNNHNNNSLKVSRQVLMSGPMLWNVWESASRWALKWLFSRQVINLMLMPCWIGWLTRRGAIQGSIGSTVFGRMRGSTSKT